MDEEYIEWFDWSEKAGFKNVQLKTISPKWYNIGDCYHGLIRQSDKLQSSETDNCFIMQTFINGEPAETMKLLLADRIHEALKIVGTMLKESLFD